jgi:hypothetical protein
MKGDSCANFIASDAVDHATAAVKQKSSVAAGYTIYCFRLGYLRVCGMYTRLLK